MVPGAANHLRRMQQGRPKTPREASVVSKRAARLGAFEVQLCFVRDGRLECAHREFELHSTSIPNASQRRRSQRKKQEQTKLR